MILPFPIIRDKLPCAVLFEHLVARRSERHCQNVVELMVSFLLAYNLEGENGAVAVIIVERAKQACV